MSYKLQVTSEELNIACNVRYENLSKSKRPSIVAKNKDKKVVENLTTYKGEVLKKGSTQKKWLDEDGIEYSKDELTFWADDSVQVEEIGQTKVLEIEGFQAEKNYTDTYVIGTFYEMSPCDNDLKKDIDRDRAKRKNLSQMYKLWKHLKENKLVARGEFCPSTRGFMASDGYIRAIDVDGKWGLEIGVFKEEKIFTHLNEGEPKDTPAVKKSAGKRMKFV